MITTTRYQASPKNIGAFAMDARLTLADIVIIPSNLYNAEGFHEHTDGEIIELERMQHKILTGVLEVPISTPYYPLLLECGWWTMAGRIAYKKLMLYHNIVTSDNRRVVKKVIEEQRKFRRKTTWYASVKREIQTYNIELDPKEELKSRWKKHVKVKITERMEKEIRERCTGMTKARTIKDDVYERKKYLQIANFSDTKKILKTRLHMNKFPGNYKGSGEGICPLCNIKKGNLEHYFQCKFTRQLVEVWEVGIQDIGTLQMERMKAVANFAEKVELLLEPMMRWKPLNEREERNL